MEEFLQHALSPVNLVYTGLLILMLVYWSTVILGVLDLHSMDIDMDVDADANLDMDMDADADGHFHGVLKFFHVGDVPVMILVSIAILIMWANSMLATHYLESSSILLTLALVLPNLFIGLLVAKVATLPLKHLFETPEDEKLTNEKMIGMRCTVKTGEVNDRFGQAEIGTGAAPHVINVRTRSKSTLHKGDQAVIVDYDEDDNVYAVAPLDLEV